MNTITGTIEELSIGPNYWQTHWFWLSTAWFGASFLAVLNKKKCLESIITRLFRGILYIYIYLITFGLAAASFWRLTPIFYRFDSWPLLRRTHLIFQILLGFVLVYHFLNGICSFFSKDSRRVFLKLQSPLGHLYRSLIILCVFILNRYYLGAILIALGLGEWAVLRASKNQTLKQHNQ